MTEQEEVKRLARCMYRETMERLDDPRWAEVAQKVTLLYGPPMVRPDVFLVSFQGGGEDQSPSRRTWPERLVYIDDHYKFGSALRRNFREAGLHVPQLERSHRAGGRLSETLAKRTVAMAACFPEATSAEANKWMCKRGARAEWRTFSSDWVKRLIGVMRPRTVLLFGDKASRSLGLHHQWRDVQSRPKRGMVYARGEIDGFPAVYCHHLSQGWAKAEVQECLAEVKRLVSAD